MKKIFTAFLLTTIASVAAAEVQEQAHYSLKGHRESAAPAVLRDQAGKSPALAGQGAPKIVADAPELRGQEYTSSIQFDDARQCYSVAKNLVEGDNFVVEAWVKAENEKDAGWHAIVANGNGGRGFIIAPHDDKWEVLAHRTWARSMPRNGHIWRSSNHKVS